MIQIEQTIKIVVLVLALVEQACKSYKALLSVQKSENSNSVNSDN